MSFPFGGHPTLGEYLRWAERAGCSVSSGVVSDPAGRPSTVVVVTNPKGGHVIIVGKPESERLAPAIVSNYDRRLGLNSGFPTAPGVA